MMIQLQKYNIQLVCKPGREMYRVDILSRAYLEIRETETVSEEIEAINMIKDLAITEQRLKEIQQHTESDTQLQKLKHVIQFGWPEMKYGVSHDTSIYFDVRDELTVQNGLIFKSERVVIPKALRLDMTRKIPSSHIGVGCLRRARENRYWPGITLKLKTLFRGAKHALMRPWAKVGIDIMTFEKALLQQQ
jgi:hypothetical protein